MDSKDFLKMIKEKAAASKKRALSVYSYKQRQSRPRVKKDILRESNNALDDMYGYYDSNCVVRDDKDYTNEN